MKATLYLAILAAISFSMTLTSCMHSMAPGVGGGQTFASQSPGGSSSPSSPTSPKPPVSPNQPTNGNPLPTICSPLSFQSVVWPSNLSNAQQVAFELGLNISGSFEGNDGWSNLANDFDGMGLSMGLLNQTLGTGSLEPLWIEMRDQYPTRMRQIFSSAQLASILQMLSAWQGTNNASLRAQSQWREAGLLSPLDEYGNDLRSQPQIHAFSTDSNSVAWALKTVYSDNGQTFIPAWRTALINLGNDPDYVSLQIAAADYIHQQAWQLMNQIGVTELRSYLLMFDFVVQDGGIYASDLADYQAAVSQNPGWNDTQKLIYLMNLRLRHVNPTWVADVKSRKTAIINGSGLVHGENRNLQKEYCYDGSLQLK